ncbi:MAG: hypothetical protein DRQ51_07490 [Gammaproteobacteria bacterium]|nr:MAG: hypothetical protein DRQ51_07490 [Gammaproteobacteria bacterium]
MLPSKQQGCVSYLTCNNQSKAVKILGISRNTLKTKLNKINSS